MLIYKLKSFLFFLLLIFASVLYSCTSDNEIYDKELDVKVVNGIGEETDRWVFKYPKSLRYNKDIDDAIFVDDAIMRTLANDPEGWGYGCYCAFKTLVLPDLLVNTRDDYVNASAIMLRRMEMDCFPSWRNENFKDHVFELQQAATERILHKSGYEIKDWKAERPKVINGIDAYIYTYKAIKNGVEVKHKVACLVKDEYTCELSLRSDTESYKFWVSKFDKILNTVALIKIDETIINKQLSVIS